VLGETPSTCSLNQSRPFLKDFGGNMENKYRGVPIEVDGQPLFLRFDFNSLVALEEALGTQEFVFGKLGFKGQRAMIWAGLHHQKDAPTLAEVGDMLGPYLKDPKRYTEIIEAAAKAYALAFPDSPKAEEAEEKKSES
jgi:hypothetical protein